MFKNILPTFFLIPLAALAQPTWQSGPPPAPEPIEVFRIFARARDEVVDTNDLMAILEEALGEVGA